MELIKKEENQKYWDVLEGKLSLPDTLKTFGYTNKQTASIMSAIKGADTNDSSVFFFTELTYYNLAYLKLIDQGEINPNEFWPKKDKYYSGDMAFKGRGTYRYLSDEDGWQKI